MNGMMFADGTRVRIRDGNHPDDKHVHAGKTGTVLRRDDDGTLVTLDGGEVVWFYPDEMESL